METCSDDLGFTGDPLPSTSMSDKCTAAQDQPTSYCVPGHIMATKDLDRTDFAPCHDGRHVLPNSPLFSRLLRHARRNRIAIKDKSLDLTKTYGELLAAVLSFREVAQASLPPEIHAKLTRGEEVYIGVLAAGGYEFTVAMLTVLALGAAAVPMCECSIPRQDMRRLILPSSRGASGGDHILRH